MLKIEPVFENTYAKSFCDEFMHSSKPRFIFGRNEFAESIAKVLDVDGFIDDFTNEKNYLGKPIIAIEDVPDDALVVVVVVIGKPLIAEKRVKQFQFNSLDYFSFYKYAGLDIKQVLFWDGFTEDFKANFDKYEGVYTLLHDKASKNQFHNIINFRLSYDLNYMRGFPAIEDRQYFEDFLALGTSGETFIDIGAFDGYTSQEFIRLCPGYRAVYLFEPDGNNIDSAKKRLARFNNIFFHQKGLSNEKKSLRFDSSGSSSKISETGSIRIEVDRLDDIVAEQVSFIKMDIEGAEAEAIEGAVNIIEKYHPKLAISAYHKPDDLWKIPEQILAIRNDYHLYLRHYTEGIAETVMFFVPKI